MENEATIIVTYTLIGPGLDWTLYTLETEEGNCGCKTFWENDKKELLFVMNQLCVKQRKLIKYLKIKMVKSVQLRQQDGIEMSRIKENTSELPSEQCIT